MKYIKSNEDYFDRLYSMNNPKYNVGDYVLLDLNEVNKEWNIVDNEGNFVIPDKVLIAEKLIDYYEVKFSSNEILHVKEKCIKRLLTPEEIEQFNLDRDSKKYGL